MFSGITKQLSFTYQTQKEVRTPIAEDMSPRADSKDGSALGLPPPSSVFVSVILIYCFGLRPLRTREGFTVRASPFENCTTGATVGKLGSKRSFSKSRSDSSAPRGYKAFKTNKFITMSACRIASGYPCVRLASGYLLHEPQI